MDIQRDMERKNYEAAEKEARAAGGCTGNASPAGLASREKTARDLLEQAIRHVEYETIGLRELLDALPAKLPREADQALAKLIQRAGYTQR